ncbi:MAG: aminopeptidase P family protein [Mesorhizobium sp.]|uniref:M24 family metallopeptidase n=1 Tax=Mesorhizobium sp. TaxID=1871066 RepID=UPI000FE6E04C|nr:Xaa-Pro peptidase family protein [Mesorhizobium sp.]RWI31432.1 MAG: aminopeptidase P family protein [Mesorhizobium sp.]TIO54367.1 MAG: aminopeptidase P family protein [Mesorhizobium sp.]TIO58126.1 MAG: aminopeptidase P family protein [Mesorhizobium sp.]TJV63930.1 MAG: aminopeptidase P family protein [Mesorhizobium sp.]
MDKLVTDDEEEKLYMNDKNIVQAFETSEFRTRLEKARALMSKAGMDALVVTSQADQVYLLGYEFHAYSPQGVLVTLDDDPYFILRKMDADTAADAGCWLPQDRVVGYAESCITGSNGEGAWEAIGRFVRDKVGASARIGVEVSALGMVDYPKLVGALGVQEPLDASDLVATCALVKSERELFYMREAAVITDRALVAGMDKIAVGTRHCEAAAAIMSVLCAGTEGIPGGPPPWLPHIRGGRFSNAPHQPWMDDVFAAGEQYFLELSAARHRHSAPVTRMAHLGPATARRKNQHEGGLAGLQAAVDTMRPGATCGDVARAYDAAIRPYGLTRPSRIGYSIGVDSISGASLAPNNDTEILANMTFHLQSAFYERGERYMLSDTVRVTENGAELMSAIPHTFVERPA